jgi:hypothetical protein
MAIDGIYNITLKTPMGDQNAKLTLKTDGETLTGTSESAMTGVTELTDGMVKGNELTWTENAKTPMGPLTFNMTATVNGDKISGQANSPFGTSPFEGSRES